MDQNRTFINATLLDSMANYTLNRMITAIAGPYGRNYSQGAVGGVLAELGFKPGQVWKF